ncbi:hypothetical protein [Kitasatospora sp. MAP5-34]|uniref:hypothetical protein n=1 Tax=Kitasatospora sp. MAP5-34 TaxID=3035102 RepID=UPI0024757965|nr:hypothetical protein [Kitasatospora sp. MAP5-34]MDH6579776.1 hypothetical protein [Kitasatospora sp. MAP5-34]
MRRGALVVGAVPAAAPAAVRRRARRPVTYRQVLPRCPEYGKASFRDETDARLFLARVGKDGPQDPLEEMLPNRAFDCDHCRFWHVASKPVTARAALRRRRGAGPR